MMVAGLLLLAGVWGVYAKYDDSPAPPVLTVMAVLAIATAIGGRYLYRNGWQAGRDVANVVAVLPACVLVVLLVIGALTRGSEPPSSRTDATLDAMSDWMRDVAEFNVVSTSIWSSYADRDVTAREWINLADGQLPSRNDNSTWPHRDDLIWPHPRR